MELSVFKTEYSSNSYMLINGGDALVIDAGGRAKDILEYADMKGVEVKGLLLTHTHYDHIADMNTYMERNIPVYIHDEEAEWLHYGSKNLAAVFGQEFKPLRDADHTFADGDILKIGEINAEAKHTPGHSPGSTCFMIDDMLFTGDTLFNGSIGRADLPGGDEKQILESIKDKLLTMEESIAVYPGHGEKSTIGNEKLHNPYLR